MLGLRPGSRRPWIVGERNGQTASDNSFAFFLYCRDELKTDHVYFATSAHVRAQLADKRFIVAFGSLEHTRLCLVAEAAVFSCDMRDCLSTHLQLPLFKLWENRVKFNLSHGSTGLKQDDLYFAFLTRFKPLAPTIWSECNERSREVTLQSLPDADVVVTGFPRYDYLVRNVRPLARENWVICLTFRAKLWHASTSDFANSGVFADLLDILREPVFREEMRRQGASVTVLVHHEYLQHRAVFADAIPENVEVVGMNEGVADLLLRSSLLITDHSSVAWDMLVIERPVFFYWSDQNSTSDEHHPGRGFTDDDVAALGTICRSPAELTLGLSEHYREPAKHAAHRAALDTRYLAFADDKNSERCYQVLETKLSSE